MRSKLATWFLLFLSFLILRNIHTLYHAIIYATNLNGDFHLAGWLTFFLIILLSFFVTVRMIKKPLLAGILWISALAAALLTPAYDWPVHAWKIAYNKDRYDALIAGSQRSPKVVILERNEASMFAGGLNIAWLIYDESDQIILPSEARSDTWKEQAPFELASTECRRAASRIRQHYFFVFAQC